MPSLLVRTVCIDLILLIDTTTIIKIRYKEFTCPIGQVGIKFTCPKLVSSENHLSGAIGQPLMSSPEHYTGLPTIEINWEGWDVGKSAAISRAPVG